MLIQKAHNLSGLIHENVKLFKLVNDYQRKKFATIYLAGF